MHTRTIIAAALLFASAAGVAAAQSQVPDAPQPQPNTNQSSTPNKTSTTTKDKAKPSTATKSDQPDQSQTEPASAADADKSKTAPSTAQDNPFPEDISTKAAAQAKADAKNAAPAANSPTHPPEASSSRDGLDKLGIDDPSRKVLKLESPDGGADVYDPKRATEDVRVGRFYLQNNDLKGAYDRFKDATIFDHTNAEAVYWLAEAARKLNHNQEAAQNYEVYLAAVPTGSNSKAARKALNELASSTKP
jgi:hypothetical protein